MWLSLILLAGSAFVQSTEQATVLNALREYALGYSNSYTCTQRTRQKITIPGVTVTESRENDCADKHNLLVAPHAVALAETRARPGSPLLGTSWQGEFGSLLGTIFGPATEAEFRLDREAMLGGRRVYVFSFRVPQPNGYSLVESGRTIRVPFRGSLYADYETRALVRIEMKCIEIPADSEYQAADLTLDFKPAWVGGKEINLPSHYLARFRMAQGDVTNDAAYSSYRRFSADSAITFDDITEPR